ncbi:amidohydrolase [Hydrogenophaga sp.]|uniref:amidohydrolase family protein n=1 Tax=Hydrogenophaga sp. TaxID=1904254 RepID=UPI00271B279B|nr:amidohydrolase family protein [Hydrogenophaga sp.]MDO9435483.1 amidohydrolase family protein [Hydrogenophaga sp.]
MPQPLDPPVWDCHVHVFDAAEPVIPGHYEVATCDLQMLQAVASEHHVQRFVLVQPSVYGSHNSLLLETLARAGGQHRGVIVAPLGLSMSEIDRMHALGVRGVRVNLVSPVGNQWRAIEPLVPHLRTLGWHVEWYVQPQHLDTVIALHAQWQVPCVLAHLAGLTPKDLGSASVWRRLEQLARQQAWIKLSALYRLDSSAPYRDLDPLILRLADCFEDRLVWGSDWPHTSLSKDRKPAYTEVWDSLQRVLPTKVQAILTTHPLALYSAPAHSSTPTKRDTPCKDATSSR